MFFLRQFYNMTSTEVKYVIPEYSNVIYFNSLEEMLLAGRDPKAIFYITDATGNDLANHIIGNSMANVLDGAVGVDTLEGGAGNDHYRIENSGDVVIERAGEGVDSIGSYVTYTLPDNVENLFLYGSGKTVFDSYENLDGTGNELDNTVAGNAGNNHLMGLAGNDTLMDLNGIDTLEGGTGDDKYYVESANSIIVEGTDGGYDTAFLIFHVPSLSTFDFGKVKNIEVLHFANYADGQYFAAETSEFFLLDDKLNPKKPVDLDEFGVKDDTIGLSKAVFSKIAKKGELKKSAFWAGSKAHDKDDRVIYDKKAGDLYYDADGSGSRKAIKFADVDKNLKMTAKDFFVV